MAYQCILPPKQAVWLTDGLEYAQEYNHVPHITKMLISMHTSASFRRNKPHGSQTMFRIHIGGSTWINRQEPDQNVYPHYHSGPAEQYQ